MMQFLRHIISGFETLAFPVVCMSCGKSVPDTKRVLCESCVKNGFENANPLNEDTCGKIILPESVQFQDALWKYDKQGMLQNILRNLKYHGMRHIGAELGALAGAQLKYRQFERRLPDPEKCVLLPVPLHYMRQRKRGYNQAREIADGISEVTGISVVTPEAVIRTKNTSTQTRLSLLNRVENLSNVFKVNRPDELSGKFVIIVDDVFTTGSTTFAMAEAIRETIGEEAKIGIFTVAMA